MRSGELLFLYVPSVLLASFFYHSKPAARLSRQRLVFKDYYRNVVKSIIIFGHTAMTITSRIICSTAMVEESTSNSDAISAISLEPAGAQENPAVTMATDDVFAMNHAVSRQKIK